MSIAPTSLATRLFRLTRLFLHLLSGAATTLLILPHLTDEKRESRIRSWCVAVLAILNIRVVTYGHLPKNDTNTAFFVANHISWIDIWALKQLHTIHFVAKSDIRDWPLIGWLAQKTGTLFIERTRRHDTARMLTEVEEALNRKACVCLFPEGTTTDGTELKPFKASLFQAAINNGAQVWPVALHYPDGKGGANTAVAYSGETSLWESLWAVLSQREIVIEMHFFHPIPALGQERRHLASLARHAIASLPSLHHRKAPETAADLPIG